MYIKHTFLYQIIYNTTFLEEDSTLLAPFPLPSGRAEYVRVRVYNSYEYYDSFSTACYFIFTDCNLITSSARISKKVEGGGDKH